MDENRLFLLDGMALVYRAHFAFAARPIMTSYGLNASAVLGFANTLVELLQKEKPTHLAVVFDTSAPTARHELFPEYKAQREAMPEDLSKAIPHVKRLVEAFHIPVIALDGYEADDVIGTLARQAEREGNFVTFMVTPDKDFAQLVDEKTFIWKPGSKGAEREILGVPEIRERWGVERPEQVIDILGLWGDAADNIPGVPGIGEKTAKALIAEWGSVENLIAGADRLKGKQKEKILAHAEQARLSRRLAVIQTDVPLDVPLESLKVRPLNAEAVKALLVEFEFNSLGRRLFGGEFKAGRGFHLREAAGASVPAEAGPRPDELPFDDAEAAPAESPKPVAAELKTLETTPHRHTVADTAKKRQDAVARARKAGLAGFHLDWTGPDPRSARIRGVALAPAEHEAFFLTNAPESVLLEELAPLLRKADMILTGYDLKESVQILKLANAPVECGIFDTMLAHALIEPERRPSPQYLAEALLGYTLSAGEKPPAKPDGQLLMPELEEDAAAGERAMERADVALRLLPLLKPRLAEAKQERVFYDIESQLLPVLAEMEATGVLLDPEVLREASVKLEKEIRRLEQSVYERAGQTFNLNSPKQLGEVLFDKLKLVEKPKKTKTGQYMTGEDVLAELAPRHPVVAELLAFREATKLKNTYVDALPEAVSPRTGRVHTTFSQVLAATGRLSSINPNLQNIPIRTEQGRAIRKAFVAPGPAWRLLSADYSQIELRVMASISGDEGMISAFREGLDIHTATAAKVHNVPLEEVTAAMRRVAKMVNFGIIYGISSFGLAQRLGIARAEGARIIEEYFAKYPGVKAFMDRAIEEAKACGYVETLTGRRRWVRDINSANANVRKGAERVAINTPIQGTAADMIKIAMVNVHRWLKEEKLKTRMLLQVHDELVFEAPVEEIPRVREGVAKLMRDALPLAVPVVVEFGEGADWFEAHA